MMRLNRSRLTWLSAGGAVIGIIAVTVAIAIGSSEERSERIARTLTGGDPKLAAAIIRRYGCGGCHSIPGIPGADGQVGPPLSGLLHRVYIGGAAANSPDDLVRWIVSPQSFSPQSAMPATGISDAEARDVAAYLYTK